MPSTGSPFRPARRPAFVAFDRVALEGSIPGRFEAQAAAHPSRLAVKFGEEAWSYEKLDRSANRIARALPASPDPVVLLIEQSPALIAAILGVLKAGRCYAPIEVFRSPKLLPAILSETRSGLVLSDAAGANLAAEAGVDVPVLGIAELLASPGSDEPLELSIPADTPASLYYTSGSTGHPKGVVGTHRDVLHNVMRYTNSLGIDRDDRLTLLQSPSFSGAVSSLFGALLNGAASFPYDVRRNGAAGLGEWLIRERISIYHSVPALFRLAAAGETGFPDLRLIRLEGDRMSHRDWALFRERFPAGCTLVNGLGLTECGLIRQFFIDHATPVTDGVVPVGYPVEDMYVEVVDEAGRAVDVGEVGEIAVQSRYLALGYHGRPDLTERAFVPDSVDAGVRRYRTGDLGRVRPDGCLEYMGRNDGRVRIHGEWVDLGEVEAVLSRAPGVLEAAARVHAGPGDAPLLVGYVVPANGAMNSVSSLRAFLAARLSARSVPAAFVTLSHLPLTENGKLKRAALPPPPPERPELEVQFVAPRTLPEQVIAGIWSQVLGLPRIGIEDDFFDLGGDSLTLSQVHGRLQIWLGGELPMVDLYDHPTIRALAEHLDGGTARVAPD